MKRTVLLTTLFILSLTFARAEGWIYSLDQAQILAKQNNKLILIDFYADWCQPCKKMDFETWAKPHVKEQLKKMIAAKINIDYNSALASQYNIKPICSLANAYQTLAKTSSGKGKDVFIKTSNYYFAKAQKLFKKEKNTVELERIDLLKCYNQIIGERPKPAIKNLEKTGFENLNESNKALAYFIAANAYFAVEDKKNAEQYCEKLKAMDGTNDYLEQLTQLSPDLKQ